MILLFFCFKLVDKRQSGQRQSDKRQRRQNVREDKTSEKTNTRVGQTKSWSHIKNLTIVKAERCIFLSLNKTSEFDKIQNFSDVCPTLMFVFSDVWHSDVCPLWGLSLWRLSTLTFVSLTFVLVPFLAFE